MYTLPMPFLRRKEFLNVANYISFGRMMAVPLIVVFLMLVDDSIGLRRPWNITWSFIAAIIYAVASVSDMVDGFIARRYGIVSTFGKFLDPLADKLLSLASMIMLIELGRLPAWLVVLLLTREISITALRGVALSERVIIQASKWGKYKSAFGNFAISALILHYPVFGVDWMLIGWVLLIISAVFSVGSGIHYTYNFFREVIKESLEKGVDKVGE